MVSTNTYLYCILVFTLPLTYSTISYKYEKYCNDELTLPTSGMASAIKFKFSNSFFSPGNCKIWIKTDPPNSYINFAYNKAKEFKLSNSLFKNVILLKWTQKLHEAVDFSSGLSPVLLDYHNDWIFSKETLEVALTVFKLGNCTNRDFTCKNNYCISKDLLHDGYNNCGDWSDEYYRFGRYGLSLLAKIGIVIGVIAFCGILLTIIICVIRSKQPKVRQTILTVENSGVQQYPKQYSLSPLQEAIYYPPDYSQQQPVCPQPQSSLQENVYYPPDYSQQPPVCPQSNYPPPAYSASLLPPK